MTSKERPREVRSTGVFHLCTRERSIFFQKKKTTLTQFVIGIYIGRGNSSRLEETRHTRAKQLAEWTIACPYGF